MLTFTMLAVVIAASRVIANSWSWEKRISALLPQTDLHRYIALHQDVLWFTCYPSCHSIVTQAVVQYLGLCAKCGQHGTDIFLYSSGPNHVSEHWCPFYIIVSKRKKPRASLYNSIVRMRSSWTSEKDRETIRKQWMSFSGFPNRDWFICPPYL